MKVGDYSVEGHLERFRVERKTSSDFLTSFSTNDSRENMRKRFEFMNALPLTSYLIIEGSLEIVSKRSPFWSKVHPLSIIGTYASWTLKYKNIQWLFATNKFHAELILAKILEHVLTGP